MALRRYRSEPYMGYQKIIIFYHKGTELRKVGLPHYRRVLLVNLLVDLGSGCAVRELAVDLIGEKIVPCPERSLAVPSHPHEVIEWDASHSPAGEMRVVVDRKVGTTMQISIDFANNLL